MAGLGLNTVINEMIDKRFLSKEEKLKSDVENGLRPGIEAASNDLKTFRKGLASQLETSVDSATTKLLRFGCNRTDGRAPTLEVPGFLRCPTIAPEVLATSIARNVLEMHEQTIVFKRNSDQRALLRLSAYAVDDLSLLGHVGLRLSVPPLMAAGSNNNRDDVRLTAADLPDTHDFIEEASGMIALVGRHKARSDQELLFVEFDITKRLSDTDVHSLRLRADRLADAPQGVPYQGNERFFVLATVIVTHRLSRE